MVLNNKFLVLITFLMVVFVSMPYAAEDFKNWSIEVSPEIQQTIFSEANLYMSKVFSKVKSKYEVMSLFLKDVKGESHVISVSLYFKMIGDELLLGDGTVLRMRDENLYFYIDNKWWLLKDKQKNKQLEDILHSVREEKREDVWAITREKPGVIAFSTVNGGIENEDFNLYKIDIQMRGTDTGMEPVLENQRRR